MSTYNETWNGRLHAKLNVRYVGSVLRWYLGWMRACGLLVAASSSAALASAMDGEHSYVWKGLTVVSAFAGLAIAVFDLPRRVVELRSLHGDWLALECEWDVAWADFSSFSDAERRKAYRRLHAASTRLEGREDFPHIAWLIRRVQRKVIAVENAGHKQTQAQA